MKTNSRVKQIVILQLIIAVYTLSGVMSKLASGHEFLSFEFIVLYGIEIVILGVYAILWQQIIKYFPLSVAYANRAMAIIWSMIWAALIFSETITVKNIIGVVIVLAGTMIINSDHE